MFELRDTERIRLLREPVIKATPPAALSLRAMPTADHFQRDHFPVPELDIDAWKLRLVGMSGRPLELSINELASLPKASLAAVLECAGNRRSEFKPTVDGIQWGVGAVSEAVWTGVRLSDILKLVEVGTATHAVLEGADSGPVGELNMRERFARALPIEKALDPDTLLALEMNGEALPFAHGAPLRAIVPGWYATDSVKWLASIRLQSGEFSGHFEATAYRVPNKSGQGTRRMSALSISSTLTSHQDGAIVRAGWIELQGIAWGAKSMVDTVEVSINGLEWRTAQLERPASPYGRVFWSLAWHADPGMYSIRVRATDSNGTTQSETARWNPGGYANASIQAVRLVATD